MNLSDIIKDKDATISRLQSECNEKSDMIFKLTEQLHQINLRKEQIITDGVNVSECKHFCLEAQIPEIPFAGYSNICCEENTAKECKDNPNCYFKQLARKTQECEELKEKLKFKVQENIKLSKENRNLKNWVHLKGVEIKVNRKIKETNLEEFCRLFQFKEIQAREKKLKEWQDFENDLQWKFYRNCKEWTEMRDKCNRYREALEEIEEIADVLITETNEYESCYYKDSCGDNCYPRIAKVSEHSLGRQTYCQYEAVAKILDIINKAKGE